MIYSSPSLEVVEELEGQETFFAPKIPWLTLVACVLITIGTTLTKP